MRRNRKIIISLFLVGLLGLGGCGSPSSDSTEGPKLTKTGSMELEYAENFSVDYYEGGYSLITTQNNERQYLVIPEGKKAPEGLEKDITQIQQPLDQIYLVASAAMDMFEKIDSLDTIRFSSQKKENWCSEIVQGKMDSGEIIYAGKYNAPDYERILAEGCGLAIENNMISHAPEVIEKLESFGIPAFVDFSSYEAHPLGRVEWVKVYGLLTGKEEAAKKQFQKQCQILEQVQKEEASGSTVAFFYITSNGMVNIRSANDYVPKMIELAGGVYSFPDAGSEEGKRATVSIQMEEFYAKAKDADYLVYNSTIEGEVETLEELLEKEPLLKDFRAVKEGHVWCTTKDLYQESMAIGGMIEDFHCMLSDKDAQQMKYLYPLK